jgi:hypothetical protein
MHSWAFIINKFYVNISFNIPILSQKVLPFLQMVILDHIVLSNHAKFIHNLNQLFTLKQTIIQVNFETAESLVCLNQKECFLQPFMINILFKTNRIINIIYIFRFSFKSSLTRYISIFETLDHIFECPHNGQF